MVKPNLKRSNAFGVIKIRAFAVNYAFSTNVWGEWNCNPRRHQCRLSGGRKKSVKKAYESLCIVPLSKKTQKGTIDIPRRCKVIKGREND